MLDSKVFPQTWGSYILWGCKCGYVEVEFIDEDTPRNPIKRPIQHWDNRHEGRDRLIN